MAVGKWRILYSCGLGWCWGGRRAILWVPWPGPGAQSHGRTAPCDIIGCSILNSAPLQKRMSVH